jgi:hypothetical protein
LSWAERMPTRRFSSLVWISSALALGLVLGACTPGGQFDPTELLSSDVFTTKKKLAGDREPLFPNGVPGAETGVPADLVKGYQPPPEQQAADSADAAAPAPKPAVAEAPVKPKPKHKPKPAIARAAAPGQPLASAPHDSAWDRAPTPSAAHDPAWDRAPAPSAAHDPAWDRVPTPSAAQGSPPAWPNPPTNAPAQTNWPAPGQLTAQPAPPAPARTQSQ